MIPIVCSFNDGYVIPAGVFITSLAKNANIGTKYQLLVLYSTERLSQNSIKLISKVCSFYSCLSIRFVNVDGVFPSMFTSRHISQDAYYRLAIPHLLTEYDKVLYLDVDIIVNGDLFELYSLDLKGNMIAGVQEYLTKKQKKYEKSIGNDPSLYVNSGVLLMDVKLISESNIFNNYIIPLLSKSFEQHDQDIINLVFRNSIYLLENKFNYSFQNLRNNSFPLIIHFIIFKPWLTPCLYGDVWWSYYRNSELYSYEYYDNSQRKIYENINKHIRIGDFFKRIGFYRFLALVRKH